MALDFCWRLPTAEGITWRMARVGDKPRIKELWAEMDRKLGKQDRPNLFEMPVTLTLVAEDETGLVIAAVYGEAVIDFTGIGTDRRAMRSVAELVPALQQHFIERSIRVVRVLVPRLMARGMARMLPQFREITQSFASFVCVLRL